MPELPEVETSRRGIAPHITGQVITGSIARAPKLRWPIPKLGFLKGQTIHEVSRRAKYLLIRCDTGTLILHLGMSGSLRVLPSNTPAAKHDHFELVMGNIALRLRDPRKFGAVLWTTEDPASHSLISHLGPEPLNTDFTADYLFSQTQKRTAAIKQVIMDNKVVVGVGNIYATESLFLSGIHPARAAKRISKARIEELHRHIVEILRYAIKRGGTTLRDFQQQDGSPGYFQQELWVYGRSGEECKSCGSTLKHKLLGQRTSAYCPQCQR